MINKKKYSYNNQQQFIIYFFFVSPDEKNLRNLTEALKVYGISLHKNTRILRKTVIINQTQMFNPISQANYIGISSHEINENQLNKILFLFFSKNLKYIPFAIFYKQKILRVKHLAVKNRKHSLLFHSVIND